MFTRYGWLAAVCLIACLAGPDIAQTQEPSPDPAWIIDARRLVQSAITELKDAGRAPSDVDYLWSEAYLAANHLDEALQWIDFKDNNDWNELHRYVTRMARQGRAEEVKKILLVEPYKSSTLLKHCQDASAPDVETVVRTWIAKGRAVEYAASGDPQRAAKVIKELVDSSNVGRPYRKKTFNQFVAYELIRTGNLKAAREFTRSAYGSGIATFYSGIDKALLHRGPRRREQLMQQIKQSPDQQIANYQMRLPQQGSRLDPKVKFDDYPGQLAKIDAGLKELDYADVEKIVALYQQAIGSISEASTREDFLRDRIHAWYLAEIVEKNDLKTAQVVSDRLHQACKMEFMRGYTVGELAARGKVTEAIEFAKYIAASGEKGFRIKRYCFPDLDAKDKKLDPLFTALREIYPEESGFDKMMIQRAVANGQKQVALGAAQKLMKAHRLEQEDANQLVAANWHLETMKLAVSMFSDDYRARHTLKHIGRYITLALAKDHRTEDIIQIAKFNPLGDVRAYILLQAAAAYDD